MYAGPCFDVSVLLPRVAKYPQAVRALKREAKLDLILDPGRMGKIAVALFNDGHHEANQAIFDAQYYRPPDRRLVDFVRALARRQARLDFAGAIQ